MAETYKCGECGGVFDKTTPDDEANAKSKELFGVDNASAREDFAIICDDCFEKMGFKTAKRELLDLGIDLNTPEGIEKAADVVVKEDIHKLIEKVYLLSFEYFIVYAKFPEGEQLDAIIKKAFDALLESSKETVQ